MRDVTAVIRAWRSTHRLAMGSWTVFWGVAWIVLNIGLVVFIVAIAAD